MTKYKRLKWCRDYKVGTNGSVWSKKRGYWKRLKPFPVSKYGHLAVELCHHNRPNRKVILVHRLVLETFIGPCPEGMICLHGDDDPTNNHLENVRWGTHQENVDQMWERGRNRRPAEYAKGDNHPSSKLTSAEVLKIRRLRKKGWTFLRLSKRFNTSVPNAKAIVYRKIWKHI